MKVKLRIVQGRPEGKSMLFPRGEYVFGRGTECHVRPNSDWVSRQHCLLRITAEGAFLRDLGSRNGTLINGTRLVEECRLIHGDQVQVGPLVFEVVLEDSVEIPPTAPVKAPEVVERTPAVGDTEVRSLDTAEIEMLKAASPPTREESPGQATTSELPVAQPSS
jgi:pSer/pThr/pTyr-binding forkhead associated (FHA) protein